jgi:hypothetical protein
VSKQTKDDENSEPDDELDDDEEEEFDNDYAVDYYDDEHDAFGNDSDGFLSLLQANVIILDAVLFQTAHSETIR